ncbi:MAG: rhomboid family intramembrane serine protease [Bacteroidota bacterium]
MFEQLTLTVGALIGLTVLISYQAFSNPDLRAQLIFRPTAIQNRGEYYRFLTHGFIHANPTHLFFNMWALLIFGPIAEQVFVIRLFDSVLVGRIAFIFFYLAAIAAASSIDYLRHRNNYHYAALGASGAVAALIWPYIMYAPWSWFIFPPLPAILIGIGYVAYSHYMDKRGGGNIGHNAHLWGAIFGLVAYVILLLTLDDAPQGMRLLDQFWYQLQQPQGPGFL